MSNRNPGLFRRIGRLSQILDVLMKYGFGYLVDRTDLDRTALGRRIFHPRSRKHNLWDMPTKVRLRKMLEELGPTFIKFGQILSTRPDLVPIDICKELSKLQDDVPPFPFAEVKIIIEGEFAKPLGEMFRHLSEKPRAAASLSQAHNGLLKTGEKVVVKVRRPHIERIIEQDLDILLQLARLAERHLEELRPYNPVMIVGEFSDSIRRELDFTIEANNTNRMHQLFEGDETVHIPYVFPQASGKRVLTLERIEGCKITDLPYLEKAGLDPKELAVRGGNAFLKQIFEHGFFHADPHPGNLFAMEGNVVGFIDFGMVGRLREQTKAQIAEILLALTMRDIPRLIEACLSLGAADEHTDMVKLELDLAEFVDRYYVSTLQEFKLAAALRDLVEIVARDHLRMPQEFTLLAKTLVTIEGVGEALDPHFDMVGLTKPYAQRLVEQKFSPQALFRDLRASLENLYHFVVSFPKDISQILNQLKRGTLRLEIHNREQEKMVHAVNRTGYRLSLSLIVTGLLIASALMLQIGNGPTLFGYSALGVVGLMLAAILGLWLVVSIIRTSRL
ncbi:MAG: AarF/UbiB family protein [bacterium]